MIFFLEMHPIRRIASKMHPIDDYLTWTENELQLLETTTDFKAKKSYKGVNLDCFKDKYAQILNIFVSNLP